MSKTIRPWVGDINSLMEQLINNTVSQDDTRVSTSPWMPAVDFLEETDQFSLVADLPGVSIDDIDISMDNGVLSIKGKREFLIENEKRLHHRVERMQGEFYRRFTLPDTADSENIAAKIKNGVLEIIIPKKQIAKSRKISINCE